MVSELDSILEQVRALGCEWHPETLMPAMRALYTPLVQEQSGEGIEVTVDIPYGEHLRQRLDVYRPAGTDLPMLVFVPGGGYRSGEKNDGVFYRNLGLYFARHGFIVAIPNYRLAPEHQWPIGAQDVGSAIALMRSNPDFGGDPDRLFVFGHSAGATHVASYVFDPRFHPASGAGVKAAIFISGGGYSVGPNPPPMRTAYFGEDPSQWEERSSINYIGQSQVPVFLGAGEFDPGMLAAPSFELARAIALRDGKPPEFQIFRGHNHISTMFSFGSLQDDVGQRLREFLAQFV